MIWEIVQSVIGINFLITLSLNIAWILVCMRECYRTVNMYLTCKRTPDLHPIYKDVQYLSRQKKLYNLIDTHCEVRSGYLVYECRSSYPLLCVALLLAVKWKNAEGYYHTEFSD